MLIAVTGPKKSGKSLVAEAIKIWAASVKPTPLLVSRVGFADLGKWSIARMFFPQISRQGALDWVNEHKDDPTYSIAVNGPDIAVSARAAQSLSLLFFELASHSDEGLSLVGKHPHIVAKWEITGTDPDAIFTFRWEEFNTSEATRRPDSDFGLILLDRVAPEALGGTSKRYFTDVSYVYELTAPMQTVVDMNERDRTEQFSAPVRPTR